MNPRVSIVIPVYNEGEAVVACLARIKEAVTIPYEIRIVYDSPDDTTLSYVRQVAEGDARIIPQLNTLGRGPANAIHSGISMSVAPVAIVTMADGCDDPGQIEDLTRLVERGVVIACASRYAQSGQQVGGPLVKGTVSRLAGLSLYWFARVGTRDATNSYKAYNRSFVEQVGIESDSGFEIGIELVAKARRARLPVAEIPTIWLDRTEGLSKFRLWAWLPRYVRWYMYAFGRKQVIPGFRPGIAIGE